MSYKYITENNLENKQTYMYSEYGGTEFLAEYRQVRESFCKNEYTMDDGLHVAREELDALFHMLEMSEQIDAARLQLDFYTKSFEVRKRIYTEYASNWKPVENAGYTDYDNYLLFAKCLIKGYERTGCTKYVSCLLKVNDTLLSVEKQLTNRQKVHLQQIIHDELKVVSELQDAMGVEG